jgi:hypothetical protein
VKFLETFQRKDMKITTKGIGENLIGFGKGMLIGKNPLFQENFWNFSDDEK